MPATSSTAQIRTIDADGTAVRVSTRGTGTPLLLIMGIGGNLSMWQPFEDALVPHGFQTIAFDMPGTGGSPSTFPPRCMRGLARLTTAVLDELGHTDPVDVLGVSYGGAVAQTVAHRHPDRVRRLVLAATAPGLGGLPPRPGVALRLATPLRYWSPRHYERIAGDIYGGSARRGSDPVGRFEHPPSLYGYLAQAYAIAGWSSLPWLRRLTAPTLVLAGDDDPLVPMANARLLTRLIPHATLHVIDGGGHLFLVEHAAESATRVATFLA